jgi:hypothetical protein
MNLHRYAVGVEGELVVSGMRDWRREGHIFGKLRYGGLEGQTVLYLEAGGQEVLY